MNGKTSTGFNFKIDPEGLSDWKLLKYFRKVDKGEAQYIVDAAELLLGEDQLEELEDHLQKEFGKVTSEQMMKELDEIMNSSNEVKNS